jgi:LPXTG-site transpeptidase (sortase) family protein
VLDVPNASPPDPAEWTAVVEQTTAHYGRRARRRRRFDQTLFAVELVALLGLIAVATRLWQTNRELNADLAAVQRAQVAQIVELQAQTQGTATAMAAGAEHAQPVATAITPNQDPVVTAAVANSAALAAAATTAATAPTPIAPTPLPVVFGPGSRAVVLPGGHKPPAPGQAPEPGEAGELPEELIPALLAYDPLPTPAPGPELALRIRIPAIGVDHPIVQGDEWEQLKLGVGQHIGSAQPGQVGNVVLSAHNDIYGEIFRDLDRLAVGNEVILSTAGRDYTYVIEDMRIVAPTDVWVMGPTEQPQVTLISCFPFRINTHRIAVFGRLVEPSS